MFHLINPHHLKTIFKVLFLDFLFLPLMIYLVRRYYSITIFQDLTRHLKTLLVVVIKVLLPSFLLLPLNLFSLMLHLINIHYAIMLLVILSLSLPLPLNFFPLLFLLPWFFLTLMSLPYHKTPPYLNMFDLIGFKRLISQITQHLMNMFNLISQITQDPPNMFTLVGFKSLTAQIIQHLPYQSHIASDTSDGQKMNIGTFE